MSIDIKRGQEKQLTNRDRYPVPFNIFDLLTVDLKMDPTDEENLKTMGKVFEILGYYVSIHEGSLDIFPEPFSSGGVHPQLISLNKNF